MRRWALKSSKPTKMTSANGTKKKEIVLGIDVYGTLLSTDSIAKKLANYIGEDKAKTVATTWRKYQLEYTWRLNSMGVYVGFDMVTRRSMRHALSESGEELDDAQIQDVMKAYDSLSTFPDVQPALKRLGTMSHVSALAFSNGTRDMVTGSIRNSPDLSAFTDIFTDVVTVDECRKYKPAAEAYWHLAKQVGKNTLSDQDMRDIWLISGNPFDIVGGRGVGMNAIFVDRAGNGWQDQLAPSVRGQPTEIVRSLEEVADVIEKHYK